MHPPRPRAAHPAPTPRRTPRLAYPLAGTGLTLPVTLLLLQVRLNWLLPTSVASLGIMLAHLSATCADVLPAVSPWHCQLVAAGMAAAGMRRRGVVLLHRLVAVWAVLGLRVARGGLHHRRSAVHWLGGQALRTVVHALHELSKMSTSRACLPPPMVQWAWPSRQRRCMLWSASRAAFLQSRCAMVAAPAPAERETSQRGAA